MTPNEEIDAAAVRVVRAARDRAGMYRTTAAVLSDVARDIEAGKWPGCGHGPAAPTPANGTQPDGHMIVHVAACAPCAAAEADARVKAASAPTGRPQTAGHGPGVRECPYGCKDPATCRYT